jgi:hypothetical protein
MGCEKPNEKIQKSNPKSHYLKLEMRLAYVSWWRQAAGRAEKGYACDFGTNTIECNTLGGIGTAASASPANGIPDTELRVEFS